MSLRGVLLKFGVKQVGNGMHLTRLGGAYGAELLGAGTTTTKAVMSKVNGKALNFVFSSTATSGDNRGMYLRTYFSGIGGGGDAARIFATVNAVGASTVHGLHASLNFGAYTDKVTGQATAIRATLHIPNGAMPAGGTYSAAIIEAYFDGTSANPAAVTQLSMLRFVVAGGNSTVRQKMTKLFTIEDAYDNAAGMVLTAQNEPTWTGKTCLIRVKINGTDMNLIAVNPA